MSTMRTGVNLIPEEPLAAIVGLAVTAERLGFDRCWVYDEGLVTRDVWVTLTAIAAATETMHLGPGITNPYTRHPAQTASAVASLHELTGGRAFLGVGAGGSLTLDPIGLARIGPLGAVRELIEISRSLFAGGPADHDGDRFTLRSATMDYGHPDIEIWLAGRGPKMLALGATTANGVLLDFIHRDHLAAKVDEINAAARGANRTVELCYSTAIVSDEDDLEFVRPHMTYRLVDAPPEVKATLGMTDADVDRIRTAMAGGLEAAAEHVRDEWVLPFVISGTAADCTAEIAAMADRFGFAEFLLPMFAMPDAAGYLERTAAILARAS